MNVQDSSFAKRRNANFEKNSLHNRDAALPPDVGKGFTFPTNCSRKQPGEAKPRQALNVEVAHGRPQAFRTSSGRAAYY
jgi:hypothetical protein